MAYKQFKKDGTPAKKPGKKPSPDSKPFELKGFGKGKLRPHVWKCGPDEYKHQMYTPWMMARAQANFRKEEWNLSFEEYFDAWDNLWDQRGRLSEQLCMTRIDYFGAWEKNNIEIITRKEHCSKQREFKALLGYDRLGYKKPGRKRVSPTEDIVYTKMRK
jgi:hypothetical protein